MRAWCVINGVVVEDNRGVVHHPVPTEKFQLKTGMVGGEGLEPPTPCV